MGGMGGECFQWRVSWQVSGSVLPALRTQQGHTACSLMSPTTPYRDHIAQEGYSERISGKKTSDIWSCICVNRSLPQPDIMQNVNTEKWDFSSLPFVGQCAQSCFTHRIMKTTADIHICTHVHTQNTCQNCLCSRMHACMPKMSVSRLDGHPIARTDTNVPIWKNFWLGCQGCVSMCPLSSVLSAQMHTVTNSQALVALTLKSEPLKTCENI